MNSSRECLDLLAAVLPQFHDSVTRQMRDLGCSSSLSTNLDASLETLNRNSSLILSLTGQRRPRQESFESQSKRHATKLLDLIESLYQHPSPFVPSAPSAYEYPRLERVIQKRGDPVKLPSYDELGWETILEALDEVVVLFEQILEQYPSTLCPERKVDDPISPRRVSAIRETMMEMKMQLDEEASWQCSCSSPHPYMVFLATNRPLHKSNDDVIFDMVIATSGFKPLSWKEGKLHAELSGFDDVSKHCDENGRSAPITPPNDKLVRNLCARSKMTPQKVRLGFRLKASRLVFTHAAPAQLKFSADAPTITLREVIKKSRTITYDCRAVIAILISYSVLYMMGSTWLPPSWDSGRFRFLLDVDKMPHLRRPLIGSGFCADSDGEETIPPGEIHQYPDILQLGILLLEIFIRCPIRSRRDDNADIGDPHNITMDTDFFTAARVLDEDWKDTTTFQAYRRAVEACLYPESILADPTPGMVDPTSYIQKEIIAPLERDLASRCNIQPHQLDDLIRESTSFRQRVDSTRTHKPVFNSSTLRTDVSDHPETYPAAHKCDQSPSLRMRRQASEDIPYLDAALEVLNSGRELKVAGPDSNYFGLSDFCTEASMEKYKRADLWLDNLQGAVYGERQHRLIPIAGATTKRVKIAILTSGVDSRDDDISDHAQRLTYENFVQGESDDPVDRLGYGTHASGVLLNIARHANLVVLRVAEQDRLERPSVISEAIRRACDKYHADILCLPFGYAKLTQNLACVQEAITYAASKNVLTFAAAANHGGIHAVYPANQEQVICVNSADGGGNISAFNSSPQEHGNISTLGEAVPTNWSDPLLRQGALRQSGAAPATAVAAGVAAIILEYLRQRLHMWTEEEKFAASKINSRKGMVVVMMKHMSIVRSGFHFLLPWKLFEKDCETIDKLLLDTLREV
ncbi:hypothetical protein BCR34DRAFT_610480 [Clohesyomyces aquaticus]|uniref:Uncharacterized protein n=1 Tax=Clohesyomyces aquaticus TaxID=1231657 RepID=A0A1Y2A7C3_9PLEO|nr:hypothetical protein BCR34DRAFT_610480 [Clohesyomyces aquaticus]